jgi:hypothetical protein
MMKWCWPQKADHFGTQTKLLGCENAGQYVVLMQDDMCVSSIETPNFVAVELPKSLTGASIKF